MALTRPLLLLAADTLFARSFSLLDVRKRAGELLREQGADAPWALVLCYKVCMPLFGCS